MTGFIEKDPQIRFNWGYHDGASDAQRGKIAIWAGQRHFDRFYEAGYTIGRQDAEEGRYADNSAAAWRTFRRAA